MNTWHRRPLALFSLALLAWFAWLHVPIGYAQQANRQRYEYKLLITAAGDLEKTLSTEGASGWRVVAANDKVLVLERTR